MHGRQVLNRDRGGGVCPRRAEVKATGGLQADRERNAIQDDRLREGDVVNEQIGRASCRERV